MRYCAFIGSFDPITVGHLDIIKRSLTMFDKIFIAIGENETKTPLFSIEKRIQFIKNVVNNPIYGIDSSRVYVESFKGLAVDYMLYNQISATVRGIRNSTDYEYEHSMALINKQLANIETVFLPADPLHTTMSSSNVKALVKVGVDVSNMVSLEIKAHLEASLLKQIFIGVVGRSGSGKSTFVKDAFSDIIDYDAIVKEVWTNDQIREDLIIKFKAVDVNIQGKYVNEIDKASLRKELEDPKKNELIRNIMKPYIDAVARGKIYDIGKRMDGMTVQMSRNKIMALVPSLNTLCYEYPYARIVALDAPLLIEYNNLSKVNNNLIQVYASHDICKARIMKRDSLTEKEAEGRLDVQIRPNDIKRVWEDNYNKHKFGTYTEINTEGNV